MVKRLMPTLSALLLFAAAQIHALSLGDITLESATGEPFTASIQLLDTEGLSVSDISVMVAAVSDFQRFDAERIAALDNFDINVVVTDGVPVVRISSPVSLDEPFLSLVLDTRWPAGRALTEYTLRLESPAFSAQSNQQVTASPVQSVFEPAVADVDTPDQAEPATDADVTTDDQPAAAELAAVDSSDNPARVSNVAPAAAGQDQPAPAPAAQPAPVVAADDLANASTLTVNAGDTLWELALRARPDDSVSVQQTMLALQRLNPDAFLGNNINRVKRGEVLRVPELSEIRQLAAAGAIAEVTRQNLEFQQRGSTAVASEPVTAGPGAASTGAAQGQLRVVTADDDSDDSADASASAASTQSAEQQIASNDEQLDALEDSLAQREEDLDRLDLENSELNTRLAMLQQQIASAQEIIRLRDLELAQLQTQLAEAEPVETVTEEQTTTITMAPDAGPVERFFNMLISNTWALLAVAAVLILLLVLVLMRRNRAALTDEQRAQRENDEMPLGEASEDELLFSGVAAAAAAAEEADEDKAGKDGDAVGSDQQGDNAVTYGATDAIEDDNAVLDDEFALDDNLEVDPDADDALTEETVLGAVAAQAKDDREIAGAEDEADDGPDWGDTDLDLEDDDLSDEDDDTRAFDDLYPDNGSPDNERKDDNSPGIYDAIDDDDDDLSWPDLDTVEEVTGEADYDIYDDAGEADDTPDPAPVSAPWPEPQPEQKPEPEPEPEPKPEPEPDWQPVTTPAAVDDKNQGQEAAAEDRGDDDFDDLAFISNEDSFDADDEEQDEDFAFLSDSDEAATKLDLARAYIDMGDSAGAREILAEVVKEGTEAQRRDAETLLEKL